jgi:hypothetical protein
MGAAQPFTLALLDLTSTNSRDRMHGSDRAGETDRKFWNGFDPSDKIESVDCGDDPRQHTECDGHRYKDDNERRDLHDPTLFVIRPPSGLLILV